MAESVPDGASVQAPGHLAPATLLAALQASGAQQRDPTRLHYLTALARRLPDQPDAVRQRLEATLAAALADYQTHTAGRDGPPIALEPARIPSALAELNQTLRLRMQAGNDPSASTPGGPYPDTPSLRRFRQAWSRFLVDDRVRAAIGRGPGHAGPLNSHSLVLESLALMRTLSPDYLRQFLDHLDTLQWLEQAAMPAIPPPTRAARKGRPKA